MKLKTITEAYDKNLAGKVARKYEITPARVKEIVTSIDPELTYGPWVLKQLATNDINVTTTKRLQKIIKKFHAVKEQHDYAEQLVAAANLEAQSRSRSRAKSVCAVANK